MLFNYTIHMSLNEAAYVALIIIELLILMSTAAYSVFLVYSWLKGAPFVGTESKELDDIFSSIPITADMTFLDIGCGDGRVVINAVKKYKVSGVGVDINPILIWSARLSASWQKLHNIKFYISDIERANFSKADIIYIYLFPKFIGKLSKKIQNEVHHGSYIISHAFKIDYLEKYLLKTVKGKKFKTYIYLFT